MRSGISSALAVDSGSSRTDRRRVRFDHGGVLEVGRNVVYILRRGRGRRLLPGGNAKGNSSTAQMQMPSKRTDGSAGGGGDRDRDRDAATEVGPGQGRTEGIHSEVFDVGPI